MATRAAGLAVAALLAATVVPGAVSAPPQWRRDLGVISKGIARAQSLGRVDVDEAAEYRATADAAASVLPKLRSSRYRNLAAVVHQVAGFWKGYDEPRGRVLFSMLAFNTRWFASHWDQKAGKDVLDYDDGTWYRAVPNLGFQFHPLENFGKLNNFVTQKNATRAEQLAQALLDRGVVRFGGLAWEYYFPFGGGRPPWISGMAQAVAAQALARAGTLLGDPTLVAAGKRAYGTLPPLTRRVATGSWIRLYAFSDLTVLNAQLQTISSLQDYATEAGDAGATVLANQLQSAAIGLLPRFDTGAWSLYALGGAEAPLEYHRYVVRLLTTLAKRSGDPTLATYAQRFSDDLREPPVVKLGGAPPAIYPWPRDGYRDDARFTIWLSKRSSVRFVGGTATTMPRGWHTVTWSPGRVDPGLYAPTLRAVDVVGNASETTAPAVEVRLDTTPPKVSASLAGRRLYWRGQDDASPWLSLRVIVRNPNGVKSIALRHVRFRGSAVLPLSRGSRTLVFAYDSSGNRTLVVLR
jgi:hypothetical protein